MKTRFPKRLPGILSLVSVVVSLSLASAGQANTLEETDLGVPIHSITIPAAAIGPDGEGGYLLYVVANGSPAVFSVVEIPSGRQVHSEPLPGVHASWSMDVVEDGTVYIGTNRNGHLYRWAPGDVSAESVAGSRVADETHLYGTTAGDDNRIYGGTYPQGKVYRYDPETDEVRDYGRAVDGVDYVRYIAVSADKIYAATFPEPHIIEIEIESGNKRELPLPPGTEEAISHLSIFDELLFARSGDALEVFNFETEEWIGDGPSMAGFSRIAHFEEENAIFIGGNDRRVRRYDLETHEISDLGVRIPAAARSFEVLRLDQENYPGYTLVGSGMRGNMWLYSFDRDELEVVEPDIEGVPITIRSMTSGPDGAVYVAGYLAPMEFARFDPDVGEIEKLPWGAQIEAMMVHDGLIYLGRYPNASVVAYDPREPISDSNPETLFRLGEYGQDRPFGLAATDERIAVGTIPKAGQLDGALTLYDRSTEELSVYPDLIPNQSIVSLKIRDNLLYGGTTVWGGLGIEPATEEATLFIWDLDADELVWQESPLPGEKAISDLTFDSEGRLWGITAGTIFRFDTEELEIAEQYELFEYDWPRTFWQSSFLEYDEEEHRFYGTAVGRFFSFDPDTGSSEILTTGAGYFARDRHGDFYYSRGVNLIRSRLNGQE